MSLRDTSEVYKIIQYIDLSGIVEKPVSSQEFKEFFEVRGLSPTEYTSVVAYYAWFWIILISFCYGPEVNEEYEDVFECLLTYVCLYTFNFKLNRT